MRHAKALMPCLVTLLLVGLTGCRSTTVKQARSQAEGRWNRVRADFKVQLARQHYHAKLFGESKVAATEALTLDPSLVPAYTLLAKSYLELSKPASALRTIEAARRAGLDSPELTYMQGVVTETRGDIATAAAYYADASEMDPDVVDYVIAYAESIVALGRPDIALQRLDTLIGSYDDNGSALLLSAHIASLLGDTDGAIRRYRLALDALGESRMASRELGLLLVQAGRYDEAIETLTPLLDPSQGETDDATARHALATAYLRAGRPMRAMSWLTQESLGEGKTARGYVILAEAAMATNDVAAGLEATTTALRMSPNDRDAALLHAAALWRHGDLDAAERFLKLRLKRHGDDATARCLLAEVLRSLGDTEDAREQFQLASGLVSDSAWAARGLEALDTIPRIEPLTDTPHVAPSTPSGTNR